MEKNAAKKASVFEGQIIKRGLHAFCVIVHAQGRVKFLDKFFAVAFALGGKADKSKKLLMYVIGGDLRPVLDYLNKRFFHKDFFLTEIKIGAEIVKTTAVLRGFNSVFIFFTAFSAILHFLYFARQATESPLTTCEHSLTVSISGG